VVDPRKVQIVGGWHHYYDNQERLNLVVREEKQLPFDVMEAGPGRLRAEVVGPNRTLPASVDESMRGRATVIFTPEEEGG
jgi:filamin